MRYILLFKGGCAACSRVAELVRDLPVGNLETRSIESAEVRKILSGAGLETPDRPTLLVISDAGVRAVSGWEMRRTLAGLLGWRRARAIARLAAAEWHARLTRAADPDVPSRRGVVKAGLAGLAGIAGAAIIPGKALASSHPAASGPALSVPSPGDVQRALALGPVQTAIHTWGAVQPDAHEVTRGTLRVLVLVHGQGDVLTLVDNSASATSDPTVLSMGKAPSGAGVRFYTVNGGAIADVTLSNGQVTATAAHNDVVPDITRTQIKCFIACIGTSVSAQCLQYCFDCITGGLFTRLIDCPRCLICATPSAINCGSICF